MRAGGANAAGHAEVWAARAWNVFNEGKPFSIVYPPMAVAGAALVGAGPGGAVGWGLLAGAGLSLVWARHPFPLRARGLLWLGLPVGFAVLEGWRAPGLLAVGLGGYVFFTVFFWGAFYYHLRTGAPKTNFLRFWRLVATNSDPTSGNALEQVPKTILTLSAVALVAQAPGAGSAARVAAVAAVAA
ncbi:MAG: Alkaline phosphodiesterase I / Nucleotide pyrophosphatase, partial [uncultured Solirubrobacteraceae bacterium]